MIRCSTWQLVFEACASGGYDEHGLSIAFDLACSVEEGKAAVVDASMVHRLILFGSPLNVTKVRDRSLLAYKKDALKAHA